jgi:hypothetical protein
VRRRLSAARQSLHNCQEPKPTNPNRRISLVVPGRLPDARAASSKHGASDSQNVHQEVKQAVCYDLEAGVGSCRISKSRQEMMPLQNLMQDDAIKKAA